MFVCCLLFHRGPARAMATALAVWDPWKRRMASGGLHHVTLLELFTQQAAGPPEARCQVSYVVGFDNTHTDALHATASVLMRFIKEVGTYAKEAAELQGRTDVNVLDVVDALSEFDTSCSELAAYVQSELKSSTILSGNLRVVQDFPVRRQPLFPPSFDDSKDLKPLHIPHFFPCFPDPHTFKVTPVSNKRDAQDMTQATPQQPSQKQQAQHSLIKLHQRLQASTSTKAQNPFLHGPISEGPKLRCSLVAGETGVDDHAASGSMQVATASPKAARDPELAGLSTPQQDGHPSDMEVDGSGHSPGWTVSGTNEAVTAMRSDSIFHDAKIGFAMDVSSQLDREAIRIRQSSRVQDAFATAQEEPVDDGMGRRRGGTNADRVRSHARHILDKGPDAILMEWPQGMVPRQG